MPSPELLHRQAGKPGGYAPGEDKENSVKLDWGKIELAVGDKVKITAIEGMEYDTIYMSSMTDEDMLGYYNQLKKFLTKEGVLK